MTETYLGVIRDSLLFFPFIAMLFTIPYVLHNYHRYGSVWSIRIIIVYSFILYMMTVFFLVVLPLPSREAVAKMAYRSPQLNPFQFLFDIAKDSHVVWSSPSTWVRLIRNEATFQIVYNVVMFIPFGMYMRYYFRLSWKQTLILSFCLSLLFEISQLTGLFWIYPKAYRLFDVDDLLSNTLGGLCGWYCVAPLMKVLPSRGKIDAVSRQRAKVVSLFRRLVCIGLDLFFCMVLVMVLAILGWRKVDTWTVLLVYFVVLPVLMKGRTLGMMVTSLRLESVSGQQPAVWMYLARYGLLALFLGGLPILSMMLILAGAHMSGMMATLVKLSGLAAGVVAIGWWAKTAADLIEHHPAFYARWSRTRIVSVIQE